MAESSSHLENTVRVKRAISPFPSVFSKDLYRRHVKPGLVWERVKTRGCAVIAKAKEDQNAKARRLALKLPGP